MTSIKVISRYWSEIMILLIFLRTHSWGHTHTHTHMQDTWEWWVERRLLPGELGHSLQEPGGVAVQRHGVAPEVCRAELSSLLVFYPEHGPRAAPRHLHQGANSARNRPAARRTHAAISYHTHTHTNMYSISFVVLWLILIRSNDTFYHHHRGISCCAVRQQDSHIHQANSKRMEY